MPSNPLEKYSSENLLDELIATAHRVSNPSESNLLSDIRTILLGWFPKPEPDIKYLWQDCTVGFICPNCGAQLVADSQSGPQECDCGLGYYLVSYLKITKKDS